MFLAWLHVLGYCQIWSNYSNDTSTEEARNATSRQSRCTGSSLERTETYELWIFLRAMLDSQESKALTHLRCIRDRMQLKWRQPMRFSSVAVQPRRNTFVRFSSESRVFVSHLCNLDHGGFINQAPYVQAAIWMTIWLFQSVSPFLSSNLSHQSNIVPQTSPGHKTLPPESHFM